MYVLATTSVSVFCTGDTSQWFAVKCTSFHPTANFIFDCFFASVAGHDRVAHKIFPNFFWLWTGKFVSCVWSTSWTFHWEWLPHCYSGNVQYHTQSWQIKGDWLLGGNLDQKSSSAFHGNTVLQQHREDFMLIFKCCGLLKIHPPA
jgi:hypothetical protein